MFDLFFLLDVQKNIFLDAGRKILAFLDWVIYSVISLLFRSVINLANFELYGMFEAIEERVFVILGIFMLFKVTISLITYLVNPDKISDKEQGLSKVVIRVITVLVMLIGLPTFFSLMTEAQNKFLPVIPRIIVGTANSVSSEDVTGISENMALTMLQGFAHKKDRCSGQELQSPEDFLENINASCDTFDNTYKYDYMPFVSTITGIIMCYVIFSLCINVAIRAFKLIILRSIAPIPIISYIDPKSSKDGAFASWRKTFFSTWAELFIQLGIIYFVIFAIDFMLSKDAWKGFFSNIDWGIMAFTDGVFLLVFLIIGLLMFAKEAPKFVFNALGIKSTGDFTRMLGMGATAISGIGGAVSSTGAALKKSRDANGNLDAKSAIASVGKGLFSGAGAMVAGGSSLLSTDKPTLHTGLDGSKKYLATSEADIRAGHGIGAKLLSGAKSIRGYNIDEAINVAQATADTSKRLKEYAMGEGAKYYSDVIQRGLEYTDANGKKFNFDASRNDIQAAVDFARTNGTNVIVKDRSTGRNIDLGSVSGSVVTKITGDTDEGVGDIYMDRVDSGQFTRDTGKTDSGALDAYFTSYANAAGISKKTATSHRISDIKKNQKSSETEVFNLKQEKGPSRK